MTYKNPPKIAENLIGFFAGPDLEDEICGDLFEQLCMGRSEFWYWSQVLRSIPRLGLIHFRNLSRIAYIQEGVFIGLTLNFMWVWELNIARKSSWPIAQNILAYSPLSPANSCKAVYILLYGLAVLLGLMVIKAWAKHQKRTLHFKRAHILFFGIFASAISIYLFINPGPYDGSRDFRIYQTLLV